MRYQVDSQQRVGRGAVAAGAQGKQGNGQQRDAQDAFQISSPLETKALNCTVTTFGGAGLTLPQ